MRGCTPPLTRPIIPPKPPPTRALPATRAPYKGQRALPGTVHSTLLAPELKRCPALSPAAAVRLSRSDDLEVAPRYLGTGSMAIATPLAHAKHTMAGG